MQSVAVESILWQSGKGGAVFNALTADGRRHRILTSSRVMGRPPIVGEVWDVDGVIRQHPVHGPQVVARSAILRKPSGRLIIQALRSPNFPGIGIARANDLWEAFGEGIYGLLASGAYEPFEGILGPALARVLVKGWETVEVESAAYQWLDVHGIPVRLAKKLLQIYGAELREKLEENPYRLLAFISWPQADSVGRAMGVANDDPRRLVAGAEAACYQRLSFAHTWTPWALFLSNVAHLLGCHEKVALKAANLAMEARAVVRVGGGVQGLGPYSMEAFIASRIRSMANDDFKADQATIRQEPTAEHLNQIYNTFAKQSGLPLSPAQKKAVRLAVTSPIVCITGGAGVGKTTVLRAVHLAAESLYFSGVFQMALSGRAAKRMTEATGRPACTISAFLNRIDTGKISLDGEFLILVDEASMLDLPHCYRIMRRMPPGTRLVLVGDAAQLPPIGFGLTFHALVGHPDIPTVELTEIHRAAAATGIPQASVAIRNGQVPKLNNYTGRADGVSFIDSTPGEILQRIFDVANDLGGEGACQVIGAVKTRSAGVLTINSYFHDMLTTGRDQLHGFAEGEPVLWTVNDYKRGLFNGSLGRVVTAKRCLRVAFDGISHDLEGADAEDMLHAYAITVHKSQGSQFELVIVPVFPSRILDRTLLYTAITRAEKQVVLIGDRQAFERAVAEPPLSSRRQTGMAYHLGGR